MKQAFLQCWQPEVHLHHPLICFKARRNRYNRLVWPCEWLTGLWTALCDACIKPNNLWLELNLPVHFALHCFLSWQDVQDIPDLAVHRLSHLLQEGSVYLGSCYSNTRWSVKATDRVKPLPKLNTWAAKPPGDWQAPDIIPPGLSPVWKLFLSLFLAGCLLEVICPFQSIIHAAARVSSPAAPPVLCQPVFLCHLLPGWGILWELDAQRSSHNCTIVTHFPEHQQLEAR